MYYLFSSPSQELCSLSERLTQGVAGLWSCRQGYAFYTVYFIACSIRTVLTSFIFPSVVSSFMQVFTVWRLYLQITRATQTWCQPMFSTARFRQRVYTGTVGVIVVINLMTGVWILALLMYCVLFFSVQCRPFWMTPLKYLLSPPSPLDVSDVNWE